MSNTLAVYHQCYNNEKATEFAVKNYKLYNDHPYYIISDGGSSFTDIIKKYNCIYYNDGYNVGMNYLNSDQAKIIVNRIKYCFENSGCEYLLLMEDDVLCRGKISVNKKINLAGADVPGNVIHTSSLDYIKEKYKVSPNINFYNACGGSILNKNIFFENYSIIVKFLNEDHDYIKNNLSGDKYGWAYGSMDSMLNFLYMICGKHITVNDMLTEYFRNPNWKTSQHLLVHQYKFYYE